MLLDRLSAKHGDRGCGEEDLNGTYPVVAPVYAVTWAGNDNPNVKKLLDWILSEEGQYIIEETGYVGLGK